MALQDISVNVSDAPKILYFFTSTAYPYHKDALDILALPSGVTYRFRYDLKYLPPELQTEKQFNDAPKNILLVHVRTNLIGGHNHPNILEHFPIREAEIIDLKFLGTFVWIEFLLGDWLEYGEKNQYHDPVVKVMPTCQKTELTYTVIVAPKFSYVKLPEDLSKSYECSSVIRSWSNLINLLIQTPEHVDSIFLKFLSLQKIVHKFDIIRQKPMILGHKIYGFKMDKNTSYRIEVLQRCKKNPDPKFDLEIFTNDEEIKSVQKTDKVQGKYDVLDFIITTENLQRSARSFFIIRPEKITVIKSIIPRLHFDVDIMVIQSHKIALAFLLGFGVFVSGIATSIQTPDQLLITGILSALGGGLSSVAMYFLRK